MNLQVIELFLGSGTNNSGILEVNAKNNIGPTAQALDMVLVFPVRQVTQKSQRSFRVLELRQQKRSASLPFPHFNVSIRTQHSQGIDSPCEARSALLVIAVLVATATFQVGREEIKGLHSIMQPSKGEDVISVLLSSCPECVDAVTVERKTALRLAIKNNQFQATKILVEWTREMNNDDVFNMKDEQGNTVLHLAIWKKQRQAS
ncbi:hypothetical protein GH714_040414 [Hevea brasiliensis]|uniref:Uncharacterized protein n=1 Tax=Hevea brasiliensis TaxID=3981 RepID=A0A6A6N942_HEVBR|nr:hypothetical protein GH714_040414 [Hevea brasiliensis]